MDFAGVWTFVRALPNILKPLPFEADSGTASHACFCLFLLLDSDSHVQTSVCGYVNPSDPFHLPQIKESCENGSVLHCFCFPAAHVSLNCLCAFCNAQEDRFQGNIFNLRFDTKRGKDSLSQTIPWKIEVMHLFFS